MTNTTSFRSLTPYACAKVVNAELREAGFDELPPQMFYTYVKKGYITSFVNAQQKVVVSEDDLAKWFIPYLAKKQALAAAKANLAAAANTTPEGE